MKLHSAILFSVLILSCKNKINNNDEDYSKTLLLAFSGYEKTYIDSILIDSTELTPTAISYFNDLNNDTIIIKDDTLFWERNKKDMQEPEKEENFAELLEQSFVDDVRLKPGDQIETVIVKITPEWTFLELGGKSEGFIDSKELQDESGAFTVKEGDSIKAYFLSSKNNEKLFCG